MTEEQIAVLYAQELELLEGWMRWRDMTKNVGGEAGELKKQSIDLRITECNARIEQLETMRGAKSGN